MGQITKQSRTWIHSGPMEFHFGASASAKLKDNTASMVKAPEENKTYLAIRRETRRKTAESTRNQAHWGF